VRHAAGARSAVSGCLKSALWASGVLTRYHRLRNRNALTVAAFHRVLDPRDPRWAGADPLWTVSQTFFAQCLDFFEENYRVVSLADVLAAREGAGSLPRWPLLITFDDGWADNRDCALPELRRRGLPAALFVVTGAIGQREGFWQERVLAAFKTGRIAASVAAEFWQRLLPEQTVPKRYALPAIHPIIAAIAELPASEREEILHRLPPIGPGDPAEILDDTGLRDLAHSRVAIGTHGVSHEPLTAVDDPEAELWHSWQDLQQKLGEATGAPTLSFPHGQYGRHELELARRLGYRLMFTSNRGLNRIDGNRLPDVLGRIEVTTQLCGGADGQFRPEKLALWLFRQPHLHLYHLDHQ
jgi:peptidoglycan/xylan/chitin deacetylase (PgdA/CDA1 family)